MAFKRSTVRSRLAPPTTASHDGPPHRRVFCILARTKLYTIKPLDIYSITLDKPGMESIMTRFPQPHSILSALRTGQHWSDPAAQIRRLPPGQCPTSGVFA